MSNDLIVAPLEDLGIPIIPIIFGLNILYPVNLIFQK